MQQFFQNRYVQLTGLTLGLGALFYLVLWVIVMSIGMADFPPALLALVAGLGSGILVYKVFAQRVF